MRLLISALLGVLSAVPVIGAEIPAELLRLRNSGLAELENEQPASAEEIFFDLSRKVSSDPLPWANLAISQLRQQEFEDAITAIDKALKLAPLDPELQAIRAEILQWSGEPEESLKLLVEAARSAPDRVAIQYALWRQASSLSGEDADKAMAEAIERLRGLRPENLLVLLQAGQLAIARQDRAAATDAYLRIGEVTWQAPEAANTLLDQILDTLKANEISKARVPALRLENVLKITPMYREGLRELTPGIQGIPVSRFRNEPTADNWGQPAEVRFETELLAETKTIGGSLVIADFDGDSKRDWARLVETPLPGLAVQLGSAEEPLIIEAPVEGASELLTVDLDNDGVLDLLAYGAQTLQVLRGLGDGQFELATQAFGLSATGAEAVVPIDFDIDGDLDLATAGGRGGSLELYRNSLQGPLEPVGVHSYPEVEIDRVHDLIASDLDRDGDLDLIIAHEGGLIWLDNLRQGSFADRSHLGGLDGLDPVSAVASVDLDSDSMPDLVLAGEGIRFLHNQGGRFEDWKLGEQLRSSARFSAIEPLDADNDGRMDLAVGGPNGLAIVAQKAEGQLRFLPISDAPSGATALAAGDLNGDCYQDVLVGGSNGLYRLTNQGGNQSHCLGVRLVGLNKGNSKNNLFGLGATLEVRAGAAYQFHEVTGDLTHIGLGQVSTPDLLRVVWSNGVPQNRLQPEPDQRIVEEQVVKGSCPFLYVWDGRKVRFVTDLLWGAPAGLPIGPNVWASADPEELVLVEGASPVDHVYDLRITEELWEAAFFDLTRLWIVDHPRSVEVASSLKVIPGQIVEDRVHGTRQLRRVAAWNGQGQEVTEKVDRRDEIYADSWTPSPYQGVADHVWDLTFDLQEAPGTPIRLILDGWIFPSDASLNLAVAQRSDFATFPPRLEVETAGEWRVLVKDMGFPAGKTKTMVVDTPRLPSDARRLRIVGTQWISFDRIAWSKHISDDEPLVVARLLPESADFHFRGFSNQYRSAPNGPHYFDYQKVRTESPWLPFPGRYTRYGDVRELLSKSDDLSVVMGPGDEISVRFDASNLPPPRAGWQRTVFLESHGWDKDADRNTWEAQQVAPLPYRGMSGYPSNDDEHYPSDAIHNDYLEEWLTRIVEPIPGILPSRAP